jgi:hypothetical protein
MIFSVCETGKTLLTIPAWEWFLSGVSADVNHHIVFLGSAFATIWALKNFSCKLMLASNVMAKFLVPCV